MTSALIIIQSIEEEATNGAVEGAEPTEQDISGEGQDIEDADHGTADLSGPTSASQALPNAMGFDGNAGGFPNMPWGNSSDFNPMAQFMVNGMFNPFQNSMGKLK